MSATITTEGQEGANASHAKPSSQAQKSPTPARGMNERVASLAPFARSYAGKAMASLDAISSGNVQAEADRKPAPNTDRKEIKLMAAAQVSGQAQDIPAYTVDDAREIIPYQSRTSAGRLLRFSRETLQMSQAEFAIALDLNLCTYLSYEYEKVKTVPEAVLDLATNLVQEEMQGKTTDPYEAYKGLSMREISAAWAKRIGVDPDNISEFSRSIGVNKSTVSRWRSGLQQPNPRAILQYEQSIVRVERLMAKQKIPA